MTDLVWTSSFVRALRSRTRRNTRLRHRIADALYQLADDAFHPSLHPHKLTGQLSGTWACSAGHAIRILFEFIENPESGKREILLPTVGTHDEVY